MALVRNTILKALLLLALALILTALTSQTARADKYSDKDPQGQHALEMIASDLNIQDTAALADAVIESNFTKDGRDYYQLSFNHAVVKQVRILVSGPQGFWQNNKQYPVLFISAGFFSGMASVALAENPGDLILVGFDYPTTVDKIKKDPTLLIKSIRVVPGQIALTLEWLSSQAWADSNKISVMGVSLGSLFMPISLRLADLRAFTPASTILAYGGAHIIPVLEKNFLPSELSPSARRLTLSLIANLTSLHDPKIHLSSLKGPFLTIYGEQDEVFPRESSMMQYNLLQGPKEIFWIPGTHIDTGRMDVIKATMDKVQEFLSR